MAHEFAERVVEFQTIKSRCLPQAGKHRTSSDGRMAEGKVRRSSVLADLATFLA
jgi:hypothetical protein